MGYIQSVLRGLGQIMFKTMYIPRKLEATLSRYDHKSLLNGLKNATTLYRSLRTELFDDSIILQTAIEERVIEHFSKIEFPKK